MQSRFFFWNKNKVLNKAGKNQETMLKTLQLVAVAAAYLTTKEVRSCEPSDDTCEFSLDVSLKQTMVDKSGKPVFLKDGNLYLYNITNTSSATPIPPEDVVTADGFETQRLLLVINNQFPGPTIEVYAGQKVVIQVTNNLHSDTVSFHWHGIHQRGTPWMDGAAFITQCPILPGHTFRYEFKADRPGTFFYHNHLGLLSIMGVQGAFIVRHNPPDVMQEHVAMVTEWNHDAEGRLQLLRVRDGDYTFGRKLVNTAIDGTKMTGVRFHSGLINGRGRYHSESGVPNSAPLTTFNVTSGESYRFRVIGAGFAFPFHVSVHGHSLTIIASDGYDIEPIVVDSFIIHGGERYDFVLHADQPVSNYWFLAKTLESGVDHKAEAVIHYTGAPDELPVSNPRTCVQADHCRVLNCPFAIYPKEEFTDCISLTNLKSKLSEPFHGNPSENEFIPEYFLNFGFLRGERPPVVNNKMFRLPIAPPLTQPNAKVFPCSACVPGRLCRCTQSIDMPRNSYVQFVLLNIGQISVSNHPIHIHGHAFQVLKIGFQQQNQTSGMFMGRNTDITCNDESCAVASWANTSWTPSTVPDPLTIRPPLKDTLTIPQGGYAVVRVKTDNPGLWMMHCHMALHVNSGMGIMLKEMMDEIPETPNGFPSCGEYLGPTEDVTGETTKTTTKEAPTELWQHQIVPGEDTVSSQTFWAVSGCLIAAIAFQSLILFWICRKTRTKT